MARFENKLMKRFFDPETGSDVYETERSDVAFDLSGLRFLHTGIDTIRQLYTCNLKLDVLAKLSSHYENNEALSDVVTVAGTKWKFSSSGKKSGFQYVLKNLEIGLVVLLKSYYFEADQRANHLKIEVTPQCIDELGLAGVTKLMREVGRTFADTLEASGVAVHLCVDMKGLDIPDDFEEKLATRSKRSFKVNGISNAHFDVSQAAFIHGRGETYLFGNASGLQMCLYNKSLEVIKSDKLDFMEEVWERTPSVKDCFKPEYDNGRETGEADTVHRLEFRIHHTIIKEFENGNYNSSGEQVFIREAIDLEKHLQGLWDYCLNNFRLHHSTTYIHPIWQKLMSDVRFFGFHGNFVYKRDQKKQPGVAGRRNVAMWLGNHIRLAARSGLTPEFVCNHLLGSGLTSDLADYFGVWVWGDFGHDDLSAALYAFVERRLLDHRLNGVAW